MNARRVHIFMDGFGWSSDRDAEHEQLNRVSHASELPPISWNAKITTFVATDAGDLEYLQDAIQELRTDAVWGMPHRGVRRNV